MDFLFFILFFLYGIQETLNLSACAVSSTNTIKPPKNQGGKKKKKNYVSNVKYHLSHVICHVLCVTCYLSHVTNANSHSHGPSHASSPSTMHSRMAQLGAFETQKNYFFMCGYLGPFLKQHFTMYLFYLLS